MIHQDREHGRIASLTGADQDHQRKSSAIDELVDLRAQPSTGATDRMITRLRAQILVTR